MLNVQATDCPTGCTTDVTNAIKDVKQLSYRPRTDALHVILDQIVRSMQRCR